MKVLIVDDNKQIISILEVYAKKEGYQTVIAVDGRAGRRHPGCHLLYPDGGPGHHRSDRRRHHHPHPGRCG